MRNAIAIILLLASAGIVAGYVFWLRPKDANSAEYVWQYAQHSVVYYFSVTNFDFKYDGSGNSVIMQDSAGKQVVFKLVNDKGQTSAAGLVFAAWVKDKTQVIITPPAQCSYLEMIVTYPFTTGQTLASALEQVNCLDSLPDSSSIADLNYFNQ